MNRQSSMKAYILLYAKWIASVKLLYEPGYPNWGLCDDLGGWGQVGGGREFQEEKDIYIYIYIYTHTYG